MHIYGCAWSGTILPGWRLHSHLVRWRTAGHSLCQVQGPPSAGITSRCPGQRHGTDSRSNCGLLCFPLTHSQKSSNLICLAASTSEDFCLLGATQMDILIDWLIDWNFRILFASIPLGCPISHQVFFQCPQCLVPSHCSNMHFSHRIFKPCLSTI